MSALAKLTENSKAYKRIENDKKNGKLSHAYLIISKEKKFLTEQLKVFAKLIMEDEDGAKNERIKRLIDSDEYSDVTVYPKGDKPLSTEDVNDLIENSIYKPLENDKKLFVLSGAENMNVISQNKLLKTLEEPPENTYILIGALSEYSLLSTIKSRVQKLEMEEFSDDELFSAIKEEKEDEEKLKKAISLSDGTYGKVLDYYEGEDFGKISEFSLRLLFDMKSSKEVLDYSEEFNKLSTEITELADILECYLSDMLFYFEGKKELIKNPIISEKMKNANGFNESSVVYVLEKITEARKRRKANVVNGAVSEWLFFSILEGKHKWQKS